MKVLGLVAAPLLVVATILFFLFSGGTASACGPQGAVSVNVAAVPAEPVAGYGHEQLVNAALIMNAAAALGMDRTAQTTGVMTAMGESGLRNIGYGDDLAGVTNPDGSLTCSLGLFQQQWCLGSWGTKAEVMDPTHAATTFFHRLAGVAGWQDLEPTIAAHKVQGNADPFHYRPYWAPALQVVAALSGTTVAGCAVSGDAVALANELLAAQRAGTLTDRAEPGLIDAEIAPIAEGKVTESCHIDVRVLQLLVATLHKFKSIGISDLNRPCIGSKQNCAFSAHCFSPSTAIDFYMVDGHTLTGANQPSIDLITFLGPIIPAGSQVGQSDCRAGAGTSLSLPGIKQIADKCNHVHIDFQRTTAELVLPAG